MMSIELETRLIFILISVLTEVKAIGCITSCSRNIHVRETKAACSRLEHAEEKKLILTTIG